MMKPSVFFIAVGLALILFFVFISTSTSNKQGVVIDNYTFITGTTHPGYTDLMYYNDEGSLLKEQRISLGLLQRSGNPVPQYNDGYICFVGMGDYKMGNDQICVLNCKTQDVKNVTADVGIWDAVTDGTYVYYITNELDGVKIGSINLGNGKTEATNKLNGMMTTFRLWQDKLVGVLTPSPNQDSKPCVVVLDSKTLVPISEISIPSNLASVADMSISDYTLYVTFKYDMTDKNISILLCVDLMKGTYESIQLDESSPPWYQILLDNTLYVVQWDKWGDLTNGTSGFITKIDLQTHEAEKIALEIPPAFCEIRNNKLYLAWEGTINIYDMETQTLLKSLKVAKDRVEFATLVVLS